MQFPSTKAEREQSIIGPWESGRETQLENGQKAPVCCRGSSFNLLQQEGKKQKKNVRADSNSLYADFLFAAVLWQSDCSCRTKEEMIKSSSCLFQLCVYMETAAWREWWDSFVAPKSMFQTPRRIFKGALGSISLYKMTTIYYSCRGWWGCWSIPVTQQLLCQLLRFLPPNIHPPCNLPFF